ncbi:hypothetical protein IE53DRAFT_388935 [Violaceomyces palustris]|uniref:Uncharacterized protein n=1 Tax=Violaceomyces palustris TaxID=1673888 RepID=A0ACD0NSS3_9BASI|nr:hypothetical protein IE53DRAFT_388935 [Violaceomyces palustris]
MWEGGGLLAWGPFFLSSLLFVAPLFPSLFSLSSFLAITYGRGRSGVRGKSRVGTILLPSMLTAWWIRFWLTCTSTP